MIDFIGFNRKDRPFFLIAGPCVIENEEATLEIAHYLKNLSKKLKISLIFKASYDKANRTSSASFRGIGISKGLKILARVRETTGLSVISDVHETKDVEKASEILDVIQIPAFLCRQTDLIIKAAKTGKVLNIKKGQFMSPYDMKNVVEKAKKTGNSKIMLTERGTTFGYNNLVVDMRSLEIMREFSPVIFDATHSVQLPGGLGKSSGGERRFVSALSRAAVSIGIDGLFLEVHPDPDKALCDGPNSIALKNLEEFLKPLIQIDKTIKRGI